jgi:hypothetical protein
MKCNFLDLFSIFLSQIIKNNQIYIQTIKFEFERIKPSTDFSASGTTEALSLQLNRAAGR